MTAATSIAEVLVETFNLGPLPNNLKALTRLVEIEALAAVDERDVPGAMVFVLAADECVQYRLISLRTEDFFDVIRTLVRSSRAPVRAVAYSTPALAPDGSGAFLQLVVVERRGWFGLGSRRLWHDGQEWKVGEATFKTRKVKRGESHLKVPPQKDIGIVVLSLPRTDAAVPRA